MLHEGRTTGFGATWRLLHDLQRPFQRRTWRLGERDFWIRVGRRIWTDMGAAASTNEDGFVIGDVVTFGMPQLTHRVVGIVVAVEEKTCDIQVSSDEVVDMIPRDDMKRIASWDEIEVDDIVKVKEDGSSLYYEANVLSRDTNGTFTVRFGDGEVEHNVHTDRILKLMSGRLQRNERMTLKSSAEDEK